MRDNKRKPRREYGNQGNGGIPVNHASLFLFLIREIITFFNERRVIFMVLRIKIIIAELIRKVCCISPKWGNRVMDILGYDNYCRVAKYWKVK